MIINQINNNPNNKLINYKLHTLHKENRCTLNLKALKMEKLTKILKLTINILNLRILLINFIPIKIKALKTHKMDLKIIFLLIQFKILNTRCLQIKVQRGILRLVRILHQPNLNNKDL